MQVLFFVNVQDTLTDERLKKQIANLIEGQQDVARKGSLQFTHSSFAFLVEGDKDSLSSLHEKLLELPNVSSVTVVSQDGTPFVLE